MSVVRSITLGKKPDNFKYKVKGQTPDGEAFEVGVTYIYREQTEYFAWQDSLSKREADAYETAKAKRKAEAIKGGMSNEEAEHVSIGVTEIGEVAVQLSADKLMQTIAGWTLEEEFDARNVHTLCNRFPGVAAAIHGSYQRALVEGKRGN